MDNREAIEYASKNSFLALYNKGKVDALEQLEQEVFNAASMLEVLAQINEDLEDVKEGVVAMEGINDFIDFCQSDIEAKMNLADRCTSSQLLMISGWFDLMIMKWRARA